MRPVSPTLAARLASGATTLCHVWKLTRRDGAVLGFTDHDRDLVIDGVTYAARSGLDAAEVEATLGLAAPGADVAGALTDDRISERDLANGLYDGARVERWLADWSDPAERLLLDTADIGEIRRTQDAFTAELRGLAHMLDQRVGRLYQSACSAEFGDAKCGVGLGAWSAVTTVLEGSTAGRLRLAPVALPADLLAVGSLVITSGPQAGARRRARACRLVNGSLDCALWTPLAQAPSPGETATLSAGCDKRFETCRDRFANAINFRGFPHIPGADFVIRYAAAGDASNDGSVQR